MMIPRRGVKATPDWSFALLRFVSGVVYIRQNLEVKIIGAQKHSRDHFIYRLGDPPVTQAAVEGECRLVFHVLIRG